MTLEGTSVKIEALPDDFIDELFAEPKDESDDVEMFVCPHCGTCEDPEHCVWGIQCPECCSPPHEHCLDPRGAKTGLHQARWDLAGRDWR